MNNLRILLVKLLAARVCEAKRRKCSIVDIEIFYPFSNRQLRIMLESATYNQMLVQISSEVDRVITLGFENCTHLAHNPSAIIGVHVSLARVAMTFTLTSYTTPSVWPDRVEKIYAVHGDNK